MTLLRSQFARGASIFGCDEPVVVSNVSVSLGETAHGAVLEITLISGSLDAQTGVVEGGLGRATALNNDIFRRVWQRIFGDGIFRKHDWTVKVDADTVFLPGQLRKRLEVFGQRADGSQAMYLNNCKYGLHGPLEVLSRRAVGVFEAGLERCRRHPHPVDIGEDWFLAGCLDLLGVNRSDAFDMLCEVECGLQPSPCLSGPSHCVAFHPFKTPERYFQCLGEATKSSRLISGTGPSREAAARLMVPPPAHGRTINF